MLAMHGSVNYQLCLYYNTAGDTSHNPPVILKNPLGELLTGTIIIMVM